MRIFGVFGNCDFLRKMTFFFTKSGTFRASEHDFLTFKGRFLGLKSTQNGQKSPYLTKVDTNKMGLKTVNKIDKSRLFLSLLLPLFYLLFSTSITGNSLQPYTLYLTSDTSDLITSDLITSSFTSKQL